MADEQHRDGTPNIRPKDPQSSVAVAIRKDDPSSEDAPRIVASGRGAVAEQILEIAFAAGVKVREDRDLAGVLAEIEVDSVVPLAALAAVAEILSYVWRANGAMDSPAVRP